MRTRGQPSGHCPLPGLAWHSSSLLAPWGAWLAPWCGCHLLFLEAHHMLLDMRPQSCMAVGNRATSLKEVKMRLEVFLVVVKRGDMDLETLHEHKVLLLSR